MPSGPVGIAVLAIQCIGLTFALVLVLTCWIGRIHRHIIVSTFWLLTILTTINSILPSVLLTATGTGFPNTTSCLAQAVASEFLWTSIAAYTLSFVLELGRIVRSVVKTDSEPKECRVSFISDEARSAWLAAGLCFLPFAVAAPSLGIAIFTAPWGDGLPSGTELCNIDGSALRVTQAASLGALLVLALIASVSTLITVLRMHRQTSRTLQTDLDIGFTVRVLLLALLSAAGAGLAIAFRLARAAPDYEWAFSIYLVSVPILSSLLFIGRDVLQIWRRWFCCGSKRRQVVGASFVTISGLDEKKKQARLHKHISSPSSEFASRMSDIPAKWTDTIKSQEAKWRQSHRASVAASHLLGSAPKFTFAGSPSLREFEIRSLQHSEKPLHAQTVDEAETLQESLRMPYMKNGTLHSPRRRHFPQSSFSSQSGEAIITLASDTADGSPRASTYAPSVYSQTTMRAASSAFPPGFGPGSAVRTEGKKDVGSRVPALASSIKAVPPARRTPSPTSSPRQVSYLPDISSLKLHKNHGASIYDLYRRETDEPSREKNVNYGWI